MASLLPAKSTLTEWISAFYKWNLKKKYFTALEYLCY